jgi:hypothetical protein
MAEPHTKIFDLTWKHKKELYKKIQTNQSFGPNGDCWKSIGTLTSDGYASVTWQFNKIKYRITVSRLIFFLWHGRYPEPYALHRCDMPQCVNPEHIFEGTAQQNIQDKIKKGRQAKGEQNARHIIKEAEVIQALELYKNGDSVNNVAEKLKISVRIIRCILSGETWKHVTNGLNIVRNTKKKPTRLTKESVVNIRRQIKSGESQTSICQRYNISTACFNKIKYNYVWKNAEA